MIDKHSIYIVKSLKENLNYQFKKKVGNYNNLNVTYIFEKSYWKLNKTTSEI